MTSYFIKHPVIAIIINAFILLIGLLCYKSLPLREYPDITFPVINVTANYPNASPELTESEVTNLLEDRLAGIEGLELMSSKSNQGNTSISLLFRSDTSMDKALSATHEAVNSAKAFLPEQVKSIQVERQKKSDGLPFIAISVESSALDFGELTHYANLYLKNRFRGLEGISSVDIWGQPFTYEIILEPEKLYTFGVNVNDITAAIAQNQLSLPAGSYQGKYPTTLNYQLKTPEDYENLLIKSDGTHPIYLKSLATVNLTTDNKQFRIRVNHHSGVVIAINRSNDANPINVSQEIQKQLNVIKQNLPDHINLKVIIDQSEFIQASLKNIKSAIIEAILLVLIIVFLFLRNLKATLIPLITIPVSMAGTLIFLKTIGYSINQMTLLAMVLAVGLVVDDAIIMLENIWRHIEEGESPLNAAIKGARQIGFAIVAMTLTLASVYAPIAFIDGMVGQLFIEFAVALAGSVFISGFVALTLSPFMCSAFLNKNTQAFLPRIDALFGRLTHGYLNSFNFILRRKKTIFFIVLLSLGLNILFFKLIPKEMAPKEDRGLVGVYTPLPAGDTLNDLEKNIQSLEPHVQEITEAENNLIFMGNWGGNIILPLKPHSARNRSSEQIVSVLKEKMASVRSLDVLVWSWDSGLPGIDNAMSGSELELVLSTPLGYEALFNAAEKLKAAIDKSQQFTNTRFDLRLDTPGYTVEVDKAALTKTGLTPAQIAKTIEVFFSGDKSMTFQKDNITYNLRIKGSRKPWSLNELYLTTPKGKRISLGAVATLKQLPVPKTLEHIDQMRSTIIHAQLLPSQSMKQGMEDMMKIARETIPPGQYKLSWTGAAKAYMQSSQTMMLLFALSILFIYAILAIQFENFLYPLIILITVPLACLGALLTTYLTGQSINIFTQVGLVTLIGLISKHGILIVEFANQLQNEGMSLIEAVKTSCAQRLRPILMTTGAMVFGSIPLILSHSAGSESRHAIGTVLVGGLVIGTVFTLYILPAMYYFICNFFAKKPYAALFERKAHTTHSAHKQNTHNIL